MVGQVCVRNEISCHSSSRLVIIHSGAEKVNPFVIHLLRFEKDLLHFILSEAFKRKKPGNILVFYQYTGGGIPQPIYFRFFPE